MDIESIRKAINDDLRPLPEPMQIQTWVQEVYCDVAGTTLGDLIAAETQRFLRDFF